MASLTYAERLATPAGKLAFNAFVNVDSGKGMVKIVRDLLTNYEIADAEPLLRDVFMAAAQKRVAGTNQPPMPAEVTPQRLSAFKGLFKLKAWDCWQAFLDNIEPRQPGYDTIVNLSNWFRHKDTGIKKEKGTAPTTEQVVAVLAAPKAAKEKVEPLERVKANPVPALDTACENVTALITIEGKGKGAAFLQAALKALNEYRPFVTKRAEEAVAAKAIAALRVKAAKKAAGK